MKNHIFDALFEWVLMAVIAFAALFISISVGGCQTPEEFIAGANAEAGNAYSTYILAKNGAPAIKGLQDLAAALPLIPIGKVSANQLGVINGELAQALNGASPSSRLYNQIGSLIALVSTSQDSGASNPTAHQGVLIADATDVANGILVGIAFWQGQQSVHPTSTLFKTRASATEKG